MSRFGPALILWMGLTIGLHGLLWLTGFRPSGLAVTVERGAARVEVRGIGEVSDGQRRKAIQEQNETLPFWTTLALLGDFGAEPLALAVRAVAVATLLSSFAALVGRPVRFAEALDESALAQGFWVLGLAVRVGLMIALRRHEVETSAVLALPPGSYSAPLWVALRQLDIFALLGWAALIRGGWRRGQASLATTALICAFLWLGEAALRISVTLIIEAGMRQTLLPE